MIDQLTQFEWRVTKGGYQWIKASLLESNVEEWILTDRVSIGVTYNGRVYGPFQKAGLFLTFAHLKPTRPEFERFANAHGSLTVGKPVPVGNGVLAAGEPMKLWEEEFSALHRAVLLWKSAKSGDKRVLSQYIHWKGNTQVRYRPDRTAGERLIAMHEINPEILSAFHVGDVIMPAWFQVQYMINERLKACVAPKLLWNTGRTRLNLYHTPQDLISALWLQFARAVDGDRKFQQCAQCRNWFEINSPDGGRADKQFCNSACRSRGYRHRQEEKLAKTLPRKRR